jgi:hypothetical protein
VTTWRLPPRAAGAVLIVAAAASGVPATAQIPKETAAMSQSAPTGLDPSVAEALAAYDAGRQVAALRAAADAASLHDGERPEDPAEAQRMAQSRLADWLAILARFKRDLDPDFDPDNPPARTIRPPGEAGLQYAPGVDPNAVKDPALRRDYIAAIAKNREHLANYGALVQMAKAHAAIVERANDSIADAHRTLGLDRAAIDAALAKAELLPADRAALMAAL